MNLAWRFVKRNGFALSEALKCAWANYKVKVAMATRVVKFYFLKVDGTIREAYGTLNAAVIPAISGNDNRRRNDSVQVYYDTEKQAYRCYKKSNLISIA